MEGYKNNFEKIFYLFQSITKEHRISLGLFLESKNYLEKGFVSFPKYNQFWNWNINKNHKFYSS